jgi:hypothetical protein
MERLLYESTVFGERDNCSAICAVDAPAAVRRRISRSRGLRQRHRLVEPSSSASASTRRLAICGLRYRLPPITVATAHASSLVTASLTTYPCAPARNAPLTCSDAQEADRTMTRTPGSELRMRCVASVPSNPGRPRSMTMRSGFKRAAMMIACSPVAASPTTVIPGSRSKRAQTHSRTIAWSSTTRIWVAEEETVPFIGYTVCCQSQQSELGTSSAFKETCHAIKRMSWPARNPCTRPRCNNRSNSSPIHPSQPPEPSRCRRCRTQRVSRSAANVAGTRITAFGGCS